MTDKDKQLLAELDYGIITREVFLKNFSVDIKNNPDFVREEAEAAIQTGDEEEIRMSISLIMAAANPQQHTGLLLKLVADPQHQDKEFVEKIVWIIFESKEVAEYIDLFNHLLITPGHRSHQAIAKALQDAAPSPSTVPFVRKALETDFDYLAYTCSEPAVITKWFSWLLYAIGTKEAVELMREYCFSANEGIAKEMQYRLRKLEERGGKLSAVSS